MNEMLITSGDVCIGLILSRKLQRDILSNHGSYYKSRREKEDEFRFVAFLKTLAAKNLNDCLDAPFNINDLLGDIDSFGGGIV